MSSAVIVDLDGTLANCDHRRHHVEGDKKDWDAFYEAMENDFVNRWCEKLCQILRSHYFIYFVTGRPEKYRKITECWIEKQLGWGMGYVLMMRPNGNFEQDAVIKERIYREQIEPLHQVMFCIDDRKQVVDMWRRIGLTCLQCAEGDF